MEEKKDLKSEKTKKKQKHKSSITSSSDSDISFKTNTAVKGIRFGAQIFVKSFTVRRGSQTEVAHILQPPPSPLGGIPFSSTTAFLPTNFTILAHKAWHTLTLGLGTRKSKLVMFVFDSESMKTAAESVWPAQISLGEVNRRLIRGMKDSEMARFKFRKGCVTFYVYAVRKGGSVGFRRCDELRRVVESVVGLKDFLDHTAMLAMPNHRTINAPAAIL